MTVKVGIFWVIGDRIYTFIEDRTTDKLNVREEISGKVDSDYEHYTAWDEELAKKFSGADFATFPRGRVMFDIKESRHVVYADKCITDKKIELIEILFETISAIVCRDEHYRCDKCMKSKIGDLL